MAIRVFIAVEISDEVRSGIEAVVGALKKGMEFTRARPSWVRSGSMHLTLKFLGNIEEEQIDGIAGSMERAAEGVAPFDLGIAGLGVFPHKRAPRVLWIGAKKGGKQIEELQRRLDEELGGLGFEKEKRPFHPHLTLARIKALRGVAELMNVVNIHSGAKAGECRIDRLMLYKSQLHPDGAIYTKLREIALPS